MSESAQLDFAINQLRWMEANKNNELGSKELRLAATEVLQHFGQEKSPFYNDIRIMEVMMIIGRLSRNLGLKGVMEHLYQRQQFIKTPQFYAEWAKIYAKEGNKAWFDEIWHKANDECDEQVWVVEQLFRSMEDEFFAKNLVEPTINLFRSSSHNWNISNTKADVVDKIVEGTGNLSVGRRERGPSCHFLSSEVKLGAGLDKPKTVPVQSDISPEEVLGTCMKCTKPINSYLVLSPISEEGSGSMSNAASKTSSLPIESALRLGNIHPSNAKEVPLEVDEKIKVNSPGVSENCDKLHSVADKAAVANSKRFHDGTSFDEKFFCKVMQEFSNTLPVSPPDMVHRLTETATYLCDTADLQPRSSSPDFEVYMDRTTDQDLMANADHNGVIMKVQGDPEAVHYCGEDKAEAKEEIVDETEPCFPDGTDEVTIAGTFKRKFGSRITSTPADNLQASLNHIFNVTECLNEKANDMALDDRVKWDDAHGTAFDRKRSLMKVLQQGGNIYVDKQEKYSVNGGEDAACYFENHVFESLIKADYVWPWNPQLQEAIMKHKKFWPTYLHDFSGRICHFAPGRVVDLGGERYEVQTLIAAGNFAKVYLCNSEDNIVCAVKFGSPPCLWEVYICEELKKRLPRTILPGVMNIYDTYLFDNASAIVCDYYPCGTLLDLANRIERGISGLLATYLAWQMAIILESVHAVNIIHADVKPDNFLVVSSLDENASVDEILREDSFAIKLIDWGRSIDMNMMKNKEFKGRAGTDTFDCFEMQDGRPWTYQTDFFNYASTLHVIIFGKYMTCCKDLRSGQNTIQFAMRRRWEQYEVLQQIFDLCLNIADCKSFPKWSTIKNCLAKSIRKSLMKDKNEWISAVIQLNNAIKR